MNNELTIPQLKDYLQSIIHFGKLELKITNTENGKKIEVFEHDKYTYEENGEVKNGGDTVRKLVIYTYEKGKVGFIDHPFSAFTKANKELVIYVVNLIGKVILFEETEGHTY